MGNRSGEKGRTLRWGVRGFLYVTCGWMDGYVLIGDMMRCDCIITRTEEGRRFIVV